MRVSNDAPGRSRLQQFLALESAGGIFLFVAACVALILANSRFSSLYTNLLDLPLSIRAGGLAIEKPLLLWVNDGLMAIFFLLVGLEVKREAAEGELSNLSNAAMPAIAALGGMAGPALVYVAFNWGDSPSLRGWAIPTATDIAFALGVLALLGARAPPALKIFLLALAIIDDLGAILIIAVFYTADLSLAALALAGIGVAALVLFNMAGVSRRAPYLLVGTFLWACVLKSGIHATLAGVAVGLSIPMRAGERSPLGEFEHDLHPWVIYGVLPAFAFCNAGLRLTDIAVADLLHPVQIGVALGLLVGKPLGVFGAIWAATRLRLAALPNGVDWLHIYGVALLTGVGFTMSLFIGTLAFPAAGYNIDVRVAVLTASVLSAICGTVVLYAASRVRGRPPSTLDGRGEAS